MENNTGNSVNQDYIWVGKSEGWVLQKMHKNSFDLQI